MQTLDQFDYNLPNARIAQEPLAIRDQSRLLKLDRSTGETTHAQFKEIVQDIHPGDVLVLNNSRVLPARLFGQKETGGKVELLLLNQTGETTWRAMVGGKKLIEGTTFSLNDHSGNKTHIGGTITKSLDGPLREIAFSEPAQTWLIQLGHVPLPPYIETHGGKAERYQTVYNRVEGSAAAPTAGLHFTNDLLFDLHQKGVLIEYVTLHVGLDTFKPVAEQEIDKHIIHSEFISIDTDTARRINEAKLAGGRIIAVGTTSARTLESAALRSVGFNGSLRQISQSDISGETVNACPWKPVIAYSGTTDLYIYPGYRFRAVDALITNFHMPKSTLMMMVSAFAGRENIMRAYQTALDNEYRFLSFGDAMFIA